MQAQNRAAATEGADETCPRSVEQGDVDRVLAGQKMRGLRSDAKHGAVWGLCGRLRACCCLDTSAHESVGGDGH